MQANIKEMIIEEVNQPKLSKFNFKVLGYGLMLLCREAYKDPEVQKKYAEWKKQKEQQDLKMELPQNKLFSNIQVTPCPNQISLLDEVSQNLDIKNKGGNA